MPARDAFDDWPEIVVQRVFAVLKAVAAAPPPAFSGGGFWEAMHDDMSGFYEVRIDHRRVHYRVFCLLESAGTAVGLQGPSIVLVSAATKPFGTKLTREDYKHLGALGAEYRSLIPRSVAT